MHQIPAYVNAFYAISWHYISGHFSIQAPRKPQKSAISAPRPTPKLFKFSQALATRGGNRNSLQSEHRAIAQKNTLQSLVRSEYEIDTDLFMSGGKFRNNRFVKWTFFFRVGGFDTILETVKAKYRRLNCKNTTVSNGFGGQFPQTMCVYADLWLHRRISVDTGALILSDKSLEEPETANKISRARRDM